MRSHIVIPLIFLLILRVHQLAKGRVKNNGKGSLIEVSASDDMDQLYV
jgi:hypothetical protein